MLVDGRSLAPETRLAADVCVIGAGAAGLTVARRAAQRGLQVCVLEGGGLDGSPEAADLLGVESAGLPYRFEGTRQAGLGGTTRTWAGWCRPLEPIDLEARPVLGPDGWPLTAGELAPFYRAAHEVCGVGPFAYEATGVATPRRPALALSPERIQTRIWRFSTRLRFGEACREELRRSSCVRVVLHAWTVSIDLDEAGRRVGGARAATADGRTLEVRARAYVVAAGGIENARLLLDSGPAGAGGLGNGRGLVGRFFAEHPYVNAARLVLADPRRLPLLYLRHSSGGWPVQGVLTLADALVRAEGLVRCGILLLPPHRSHPDFASPGVVAARRLVASAREGRRPADAGRLLREAIADVRPIAATAARALLRPGRATSLIARAFLESVPNPDSRVCLAEARDGLGRRRARVEWRLDGLERRTLERTLHVLGEELQRAGVGRLVPFANDPELGWPAGLGGGRHHMGTTRMSDDPARGVVDRHCRVHGLPNLYVAGSSVFPSSGLANPTLTIVALSLRLAEHLAHALRARAS